MKCENCGAEITDKMKFCSECGTRVPTDKECPACHTRCALAAKFCSECGHDFSKLEEIEEDTGDDDNDSEEDTSSSGHYSVILKDCGEDKGAVLRDLVAMTGKRLWPDISDMVDNLPAVVAKGLTRDKADLYYGGLLLDGAQAEIVADEDGDGDSDDDDSSPGEPYPEMVDIPGRNFKLGCTPVTQAQWEAVMGYNPSYFTYKGANRPVEQVSWDDCQEFIEKLNEQTGMCFRLPTQKEWEYACRAGSKGDYGLVEGGEEGDIDDMGWYDGNSDDETHPVAQKQPNAWGLYDMHGNVSTWCADASGPSSHVVCGGGFNFDAGSCTATYRNGCESDCSDNWIGLRLAMDCDSDTDDDESEEEDSSSAGSSHKSRTCSVFLKDIGNDKNAVIREVRRLFNKTFGEAKNLVETNISPIPLHLDCLREKAEEIAAALEAVGATVEISDKDVGTVTSGNCSVVIKKLPFMMGRGDRMGVACIIAEAEGCMPANAWKMLDNLPLTFAKNISREEAEEIASKIEARKCKVEIV